MFSCVFLEKLPRKENFLAVQCDFGIIIDVAGKNYVFKRVNGKCQFKEIIMAITLIVTLTAKPGKEEELKAELISLVEPSRKDAGCINYDLHQSTDDKVKFMFHENWETAKDLEAHGAKPIGQAFMAKADELLAGDMEVSIWENIS